MINHEFLVSGDLRNPVFLMLHGSGAGCRSDWMTGMARRLCDRNIGVVRADFAWMTRVQQLGRRCPPPAVARLQQELASMIEQMRVPVVVGGKSLGGRVASMLVADSGFQESTVSSLIKGCVCLGYPFHPPAQSQRWRTAHFPDIPVPLLLLQGSRDPFGYREEVISRGASHHDLSGVNITWLEDGDHDFKPRKASGLTQGDLLHQAADLTAAFVLSCFDSVP
jgi:uncharacterized protein